MAISKTMDTLATQIESLEREIEGLKTSLAEQKEKCDDLEYAGENLQSDLELAWSETDVSEQDLRRIIGLAHEALTQNNHAEAYYHLDTIVNPNTYKTHDKSQELYEKALLNRAHGERPTINLADSKLN